MAEEGAPRSFRRGREHIKAAATRKGSGGFNTNWFNWQDGETKYLRFLWDLDETITIWVHEQVHCSDGKYRTFVCRKEVDGDDTHCELCVIYEASIKVDKKKPKARRRELSWGIAVERHPVRETDEQGAPIGPVLGYQDVTEEIDDPDKQGEKKVIPHVGIVRQGPKNFWSTLDHAFETFGTIQDRDFAITRQGAKTDTTYIIWPVDPTPLPEGQTDWKPYLSERFANYMPDVNEILAKLGSQEFYDKQIRGDSPEEGDEEEPDAPAPKGDDLDEKSSFDKLRDERKRIEEETASAGTYA